MPTTATHFTTVLKCLGAEVKEARSDRDTRGTHKGTKKKEAKARGADKYSSMAKSPDEQCSITYR